MVSAILLPSLCRAQVAINDAAPDLEIGAEMTLTVIDRSERGAYGSVLKFEPVDAQAQAHAAAQQAATQAAIREAKRWLNYAEMDAERGLSRTNAIRRALADNTPGLEGQRQALQARVDANIARDSDIAAKGDGFGIGELGRVPVTPQPKPATPRHGTATYCGPEPRAGDRLVSRSATTAATSTRNGGSSPVTGKAGRSDERDTGGMHDDTLTETERQQMIEAVQGRYTTHTHMAAGSQWCSMVTRSRWMSNPHTLRTAS